MVISFQSIFSTPSSAIGRVEKATSRILLSPDWMINMDICNSVNSDPWKAKAFVKAVRMRLQNKNPKVQYLALTLLEAMIKNCNDFVYFQVVERGILPEMVKIARKNKNAEVRDKVLELLESWQETFRGPDGRYPQFYNTYAELKKSGVQFPENSKNTDLVLTLTGSKTKHQKSFKIPTNNVGRFHQVRSETGHFSLSDLHNIRSVMDLLNNMLESINPNDHKAAKDEIITDLAKQCEINQKRLAQLINSTKNDTLLAEALRLNDSLQSLLLKHDSLVSRSSLPAEISSVPAQSNTILPPAPLISWQFDSEKEEEDGFSALAKRNSIPTSTGFPTSAKKSLENSSCAAESAVVTTSKIEQDLIELFSLTLSPNQTPQIPNQNQNLFSGSLGWEHSLYYPNEGYIAYDNYVVPWARPAVTQSPEISQKFSQQVQLRSSNHLPPSLNATEGSSNPFLSTTYNW